MKTYQTPTLQVIDCLTHEEVLTASEEALDIEVSFDSLWGTGI